MKQDDLIFCEKYEGRMKEFELLKTIENNLTEKGRITLYSLKEWLNGNLDNYLTLTGNL